MPALKPKRPPTLTATGIPLRMPALWRGVNRFPDITSAIEADVAAFLTVNPKHKGCIVINIRNHHLYATARAYSNFNNYRTMIGKIRRKH